VSSDLLVSLKATGTWGWINDESARPRNPFAERLTASSCTQSGRIESSFDNQDRTILCNIFKDPALSTYLQRKVAEQRKSCLFALASLAWLAWLLIDTVLEWRSAIELAKRLAEDASTGQREGKHIPVSP
jgi:hypothetical protein